MKYLFALFFSVFTVSVYAQKDTTQKEFLGILTLTEKYQDEKAWTPEIQGIVGQHFQRLVKFKGEGKVVLAGPTDLAVNDPNMKGLVIFYAKDETEAKQFMADDPAVKSKIMQANVHPFRLAIIKCE